MSDEENTVIAKLVGILSQHIDPVVFIVRIILIAFALQYPLDPDIPHQQFQHLFPSFYKK